jgi:hypothetical protein
VLRAQRHLGWGRTRGRRWRRPALLLLFFRLHLLVCLALLNVQLDEIGVLLDLVFRDAHSQQLFQQRLPRRVARVDCRAPRAADVGLARGGGRNDAGRDDGLWLLRGGRRLSVSKQTAQQTVALVSVRRSRASPAAHRRAEGLVPSVLVGVLLAVVHLLLERLGLLLVGEGEPREAVLKLKGMEEDAVLVVGEGVVDLLVPDDAATGRLLLISVSCVQRPACTYRNVHQLDPEGVAHQVVGQHGGALQARVRPCVPVRVGDVQLRDGDSEDLVVLLGHGALHRLLVLVGQDRGHLVAG